MCCSKHGAPLPCLVYACSLVLRPEEECEDADVAAALLRWQELGAPCCLLWPSADIGQEGAAAAAAAAVAADTYEAMLEILEVRGVAGELLAVWVFLQHAVCWGHSSSPTPAYFSLHAPASSSCPRQIKSSGYLVAAPAAGAAPAPVEGAQQLAQLLVAPLAVVEQQLGETGQAGLLAQLQQQAEAAAAAAVAAAGEAAGQQASEQPQLQLLAVLALCAEPPAPLLPLAEPQPQAMPALPPPAPLEGLAVASVLPADGKVGSETTQHGQPPADPKQSAAEQPTPGAEKRGNSSHREQGGAGPAARSGPGDAAPAPASRWRSRSRSRSRSRVPRDSRRGSQRSSSSREVRRSSGRQRGRSRSRSSSRGRVSGRREEAARYRSRSHSPRRCSPRRSKPQPARWQPANKQQPARKQAIKQEAASDPVAALQAEEAAAAVTAAAASQEAASAAALAADFWDPVWVLEARCLQTLVQHGPQPYFALLPLLGEDSLPASLAAGAAPGTAPISLFELFLRERPHLFQAQMDGSIHPAPGQQGATASAPW